MKHRTMFYRHSLRLIFKTKVALTARATINFVVHSENLRRSNLNESVCMAFVRVCSYPASLYRCSGQMCSALSLYACGMDVNVRKSLAGSVSIH